MNQIKHLYIEHLTTDFRNNFELKTGKKIGLGKYFDMTEIINFYGGLIEIKDIREDEYNLESYIYKLDDEKYDFKIVIDKQKSEELKKIDENGNVTYGQWNLYIMKLFYYVILSDKETEAMENGDIIYPNSNYVKKALNAKEKLTKKLVKTA